jgi:hypothetical protein
MASSIEKNKSFKWVDEIPERPKNLDLLHHNKIQASALS